MRALSKGAVGRSSVVVASRIWILVLLSVSVCSACSPLSSETANNCHPLTATVKLLQEYRVETKIAAVAIQGGMTIGAMCDLEVVIRNGTGHIYLDTFPLTQLDTQASARLAARVTGDMTGLDMADYDVLVAIRSDSTIVGGPSAGAALATAMMIATLHFADYPELGLLSDIYMTGTVNPSGTIGPVGGVFEKAEAAHMEGCRIFLVPSGQGTIRRMTGGPPIDLIRHAKDHWGMDVVEVSDVMEAFEIITGARICEDVNASEDYRPPIFQHVMGGLAESLIGETEAYLSETKSFADTLSGDVKRMLDSTIMEGEKALTYAEGNSSAGNQYIAASLAFVAKTILRQSRMTAEYQTSPHPGTLQSFFEEADRTISDAALRLETEKAAADDLSDIEFLSIAQHRLYEARQLRDQANIYQTYGDLSSTLHSLALAMGRASTSLHWAAMAQQQVSGIGIDPEFMDSSIKDLARALLDEAETSLAYAEAIAGDRTNKVTQTALGDSAASLREAKDLYEENNFGAAVFVSMRSRINSDLAIELSGYTLTELVSVIKDLVSLSRERGLTYIAQVRGTGILPILGISYLEFATERGYSDELFILGQLDGDSIFGQLEMLRRSQEVTRFSASILRIAKPGQTPVIDLEIGERLVPSIILIATISTVFAAAFIRRKRRIDLPVSNEEPRKFIIKEQDHDG